MEIIGRKVLVDLPELGGKKIPSKIDTGAFRTAVHCEKIEVVQNGSVSTLQVTIKWNDEAMLYSFDKYQKRTIKNSFGQIEERFCVRTLLVIQGKKIRSEISFSSRKEMRYPILVGRKTIGKKFLIDVSRGY
jgi:hypothetical protein